MSATRKIALNGNAGAFVSIASTIPARRVRIREDDAAASTGLQYQKPDDSFATTYIVGTVGTPDAPQIDLGNSVAFGMGRGPLLGLPAQTLGGAPSARAADVYTKVRGNGAGSTSVRVVEDE